MRIESLAIAAIGLALVACSDRVTVALDPALDGVIEVVSTRSDRPGATNAIDVEVVVANRGETPRNLEFRGQWKDGRGGFQGGAGAVRVLDPGERTTFSAGTRSPRAETFLVEVFETTSTEDDLLTATLADATPKSPGHGITFTTSPDAGCIPTWTPRGVANGEPFTARTMLFRPDRQAWTLEISDRPFDPVEGTARARATYPTMQTVHLDLPEEPAAGAVLRQDLAYGGAVFRIKPTPEASDVTSWNTASAWVVEFSNWDRRPWVDGGPTIQRAGSASGRLYVAFRGSEHGIADSWISGTFEDAPIVYDGPPPGE